MNPHAFRARFNRIVRERIQEHSSLVARRLFSLIVIFVILSGISCASGDLVRATVPTLDLNRYAGTWYEIARLPHSFEKGLVNVTATYTVRPDGKIDVVNRGHEITPDGKLHEAKGIAKSVEATRPGWLKVYFVPLLGGDYLVLDVDSLYRYALVSGPNRNYLWILSRTPTIPEAVLDRYLAKAKSLGFDTTQLLQIGTVQ